MPGKNCLTSTKYQIRQHLEPTIAPLTAAIASTLAAGSLHAATITVDTLQDGLITGQCSLRSAMLASETASYQQGCAAGNGIKDRIRFDPSLSGTISLSTGQDIFYDGSTLHSNSQLYIFGDNRITIEGSGSAPAIFHENAQLRLNGLTIRNGGGDYGGAILSRGSGLEVTQCQFLRNAASLGGGAIWLDSPTSSTLWIEDSVFSDNDANGAGSRGGAIGGLGEATRLVITGTYFQYNQSNGSGGAVHWDSDDGTIEVTGGSSFEQNRANSGSGGAIFMSGSDVYGESLTIADTAFNENSASGSGGAVDFEEKGSSAGSYGAVTIQRAVFSGNSAGARGGAARLRVGDGTPIRIEESAFSDNSTSGDAGGAARILAGDAGLILSDITVEGNQAAGSGGGFSLATLYAGDIEGRNLVFANNSASQGGGLSIAGETGNVRFEDTRFTANTALDGVGGGLAILGFIDELTLSNSVISGNSASGSGGGMHLSTLFSTNVIAEVKYSEWSDNESGGDGGGAMYVTLGSGSQFFVENSTISGNLTAGSGGAIKKRGDGAITVKYSTIANNTADDEGGGIYSGTSGTCEVYNTLMDGNTGSFGAALQDIRSSASGSLCSVQNALLSGNDSEFSNDGGNVLGQDPLLLPLADNGGSNGRSHALGAGSPAIDAGNSGSNLPDRDQRGAPFQRVSGAGVDIGAYESQTITDSLFNDRFEAP